MISPSSSAVVNRPLKKSSALISRLLVTMVAPSASSGRGIVGCRIVVGDRAADGAAVPHMRVADAAGHIAQARNRRAHDRRVRHLVVRGHGTDDERVALLVDAAQLGDARRGRSAPAGWRGAASWSGSACGRRPAAWPRRSPPAAWPRRPAIAGDDIRKRTWGSSLFGGHLGWGFLGRAPDRERRCRHGDVLVAQRVGDGVDDGGGRGDGAGLAATLDAQRVRRAGRAESWPPCRTAGRRRAACSSPCSSPSASWPSLS